MSYFPEDPREESPPSNIEAEQALLGCILFDNGAYEHVGDELKPDHFSEAFHGRLFGAMEEHIRKGQTAEPVILMERFKRDPAFVDLGGMNYLVDLVDRAPPAAAAAGHARLIHDLFIRRELMALSSQTATLARLGQDGMTGREMLEAAELSLFSLAETGQRVGGGGFMPFADALRGAVEMAAEAFARDGAVAGLSTGLIDLDQKLGGLHPSDLVILAGRPSMGKTALVTNVAFHTARRYAYEIQGDGTRKTTAGGVVAFFSLEMSPEQLAMRTLAESSGISGDKMRKGHIDTSEFGRIRDEAIEIQDAPLYIDATGGLSIEKLRIRCRRLKRMVGLDLVVVDYLQLVTCEDPKVKDRTQMIGAVTQGLKAMAKELGVPVIALSQLSRQVENREDKRPMLSDLRESGSIEQDADAVLFVYREAYYLERAEPKEGTTEHIEWVERVDRLQYEAEVIIGKQRHGPIGTVRLAFNPDVTKFGNLAREGFRPEQEGALL